MIKSLAGGVLITLAVFFGVGLALPDVYTIETTVTVHAPVETTYEQISTLNQWRNWAFTDEEMIQQLKYEGPTSGLGAIYTWHDEHSTGRMEIIKEEKNKHIASKLITNYGEDESNLVFSFKAIGDSTTINWVQTGNVGYDIRSRIFIALGGLEKSIGENNHTCLVRLKHYLEKR